MEQITITQQKAEVGQVFYAIWGYDQTNYDYMVIVKISPSGKTAFCQMAKYDEIGQTAQCNIQKPRKEGFGWVFRMKIEYSDGKPQLRGSYPYSNQDCLNDEGKPYMRLGTAWLAKEDQTFYETDSQFGH